MRDKFLPNQQDNYEHKKSHAPRWTDTQAVPWRRQKGLFHGLCPSKESTEPPKIKYETL